MSTDDRQRIETHLRMAALCLLILGVLDLTVSTLFFLGMALGFVVEVIDRGLFRNDDQVAFFLFALGSLPFVLRSILITAGAYQMRQVRAYGFVTFCAIAALVPLTPCFMVSLPVGIWVMFLLWQPEVEMEFRRRRSPSGAEPRGDWDDEDWRVRDLSERS